MCTEDHVSTASRFHRSLGGGYLTWVLIISPIAGEIVYTHLFGKGIIFLNNLDVVNDLLDKRAAIYSDKPRLVMVNELCVSLSMTIS